MTTRDEERAGGQPGGAQDARTARATDLDAAALAIAQAIGLDGAEIGARKAFLELGDADVALLREIHALVEDDDDALSDEFYEHVLAFPPLRALVADDATVLRLRHTQSRYFRSLTAGEYDEGYIRDRLRVGLVHQRIGLEPKWYLGAYRKYLSTFTKLLWERLHDDPARFHAACDAVLKIVLFDMGLALDTYAYAGQRSVLQYQNYLEQVIGGMPAGLIVVDAGCRVRSANATMRDMLGLPDDVLDAQPPLDVLIPSAELAERVGAALATGKPQDNVLVGIDSHGAGAGEGARWFEFNIRRTTQDGGFLILLIGQDVTFRRQARLRLQESEEFFRLTFTQAAVGIALLSREGRFLRVNHKLTQILGYSEAELLQRFYHQITYQDDLLEDRALIHRLVEGEIGDFQRETRWVRKDGRPLWAALSASAMHDAKGGQLRLIVAVEDVSLRKQAEDALTRMANHDALTGLPNRALLQDRLARAIAQAQRAGRQVGVMFIDLDRFKHVNDSLGHEAGDHLIIEIARRLASALRDTDTVARQGGDEFVVVLPDLAAPEDAAGVAAKLLDGLFQPLVLSGQEVFPTGSIGIAMYPRDGHDAQALLKAADSAMYNAKAGGGQRFRFYAADMGANADAQLRTEALLQRALEREELLLHYQPLADIASGRIVGLEALLRWQPRGQELRLPAEFMAVAEQTGLIVPIGEWVLATALAQQVALRRAGLKPGRIGVNLSARQFLQHDLAERVASLLDDAGCDAAWLTLEVTESALMQDPELAATTMARLAAMGVQLAIDDFGTGYSSLSNLHRFPIHDLKIDRSFVAQLAAGQGQGEGDAAIVKAVIALARSMKLNVVAEGVETREQLAFLGEHGCAQMQGYYFSRPLPAAGIERLLRGQADAAAGTNHA
jgi:diguanylate cyclase (GGDEF)-like protein/PAS domain S-box-containing protein